MADTPTEVAVTGIAAFGMSLKYGDTPTFVNSVISCTPPKEQVAGVTVPAPISGPNSGIETTAPGKQTFGECPFKITYSSDSSTALRTMKTAKTVSNWVLTYADGKALTFPGYVDEVGEDELNDTAPMTISAKVKQTGPSTGPV
jgi:hypothetical protein